MPELAVCEEHATKETLLMLVAMLRQRLERRAPRPAEGLDVKTLRALLERMAAWGLQRGAKRGKRGDARRDAQGFAEALIAKVNLKEK